jgi:uncharacterized UBP type Zn finger protein
MPRLETVTIEAPCDHAADLHVHEVTRPAPGCEDCLAMGGRWLHLRVCLTCGHVGCCDSSPGKHATRHFETTSHPVITSAEPGETWVWCYVHEEALSS